MRLHISICILLIGFTSVAQEKLSPKFRSSSSRISFPPDTLTLVVKNLQRFKDQYPELKIINQHTHSGSLKVVGARTKFEALRSDDLVVFMDKPSLPVEESFLDYPDFYFNRVRTLQYSYPEIDGQGIVVSVKERTFDTADIDLRKKFVPVGLAAASISSHASDMATIIAGRGNSYVKNQGILPEGLLSTSDFFNLLPDDEQLLVSNNIYIQNHSYGVSSENFYGAEARAYDQSMLDYPELIHIFSVGNQGVTPPTYGSYKDLPFANLTGNFKQAKNVLTIAAIDTSLMLSAQNSRGPAYDGRIKPELAAYGGGGTSDAAAMVSGISGLIRQKLLESSNSVPKSSLIKGILVAGSDDVGPPGIDYYSGYGNVNAKKSFEIINNGWFRSLLLSSDSIITIQVPENIFQLKVVVTWTDPPAQTNSQLALVNDIDATLSKDGAEWMPWTLDTSPSTQSLNSPPIRGEDHLNNAEFITLDAPDAGTYELSLSMYRLLTEDQEGHVSWYLQPVNTFEWDTPKSQDLLVAGSSQGLFWNTSFNEAATLALKIGDGEWTPLENSLDLTRPYKWEVPDTTSLAVLKMMIGGVEYLSEVFLISKEPELGIAFNCEDQLGLQWGNNNGDNEYAVFRMGSTHMEEVERIFDTVATVSKTKEVYYSVAPVLGNRLGIRAPAINYAFQGSFCYFKFLSAQRADEDQVQIILEMSTNHDIEKIELLKTFNGMEEEVIASQSPGFSPNYLFTDYQLDPGLMRYRAILTFKDGTNLSSDISDIFIEKENSAILFPNPTNLDFINILTDGDGNKIQILDQSGKLLFEKDLTTRVDFVITRDLRAGLYLYRLFKGTKIIDSGIFIIQ